MSVVYARIPVLVRLKKGHKMSLEIFRINENGAGWVDFSEATADEKLSVELGIITNQISVNCYFCHKPIPSGTGNCCVNCKGKRGAVYLG